MLSKQYERIGSFLFHDVLKIFIIFLCVFIFLTLKKLDQLANQVDALQEDFEKLSDAELQAKTAEFKERLEDGETLHWRSDHLGSRDAAPVAAQPRLAGDGCC